MAVWIVSKGPLGYSSHYVLFRAQSLPGSSSHDATLVAAYYVVAGLNNRQPRPLQHQLSSSTTLLVFLRRKRALVAPTTYRDIKLLSIAKIDSGHPILSSPFAIRTASNRTADFVISSPHVADFYNILKISYLTVYIDQDLDLDNLDWGLLQSSFSNRAPIAHTADDEPCGVGVPEDMDLGNVKSILDAHALDENIRYQMRCSLALS
ncbi:hypothetical protein DXG01_002411 [Tephrocybe rancida]|nr:hypothetical protein DXG01_002411 [Tephrocybe rancida]